MDTEAEIGRKKSGAWIHFDIVAKDPTKAKCSYCKSTLSFKGGSTSNLIKHLKSRHVGVEIITSEKEQKQKQQAVTASENAVELDRNNNSQEVIAVDPGNEENLSKDQNQKKQMNMKSYIKPTLSFSRQKKIDNLILNLIIKDLQPFSLVEDEGFIQLIKFMEPQYKILSRTRLSRQLLPALFEDVLILVKAKIAEADYLTLTTDIWTSCATESYMSITAHFIDKNWKLNSVLLDCFHFSVSHTAENLRNAIIKVVNEWGIEKKIVAIASDNAANIKAAIRLCGWSHIPCVAHTISLTCRDALKVVSELQNKCKSIVEFFHRSTTAAEKLKQFQLQVDPKKEVLKLIMDVTTRWNSTFYMFERLSILQEPLSACIGSLHNPVECLTAEEWEVLQEICQLLRPFEQLTKEFSAENFVSASKVIILIEGTKSALNKISRNLKYTKSKDLYYHLISEIGRRFDLIELNTIFSCPTFMDPRFKQRGFKEQGLKKVKDTILYELKNVCQNNSRQIETISNNNPETNAFSLIWENFDRIPQPVSTPTSTSIIEMKQYQEEANISRNLDPLMFWKTRSILYPDLSILAKKYLCVVATSVPSERVFSKTGEIVSKKRSNLKPENVRKIAFLNVNQDYVKM